MQTFGYVISADIRVCAECRHYVCGMQVSESMSCVRGKRCHQQLDTRRRQQLKTNGTPENDQSLDHRWT